MISSLTKNLGEISLQWFFLPQKHFEPDFFFAGFVCSDYGSCKLGELCRHAHSREELRRHHCKQTLGIPVVERWSLEEESVWRLRKLSGFLAWNYQGEEKLSSTWHLDLVVEDPFAIALHRYSRDGKPFVCQTENLHKSKICTTSIDQTRNTVNFLWRLARNLKTHGKCAIRLPSARSLPDLPGLPESLACALLIEQSAPLSQVSSGTTRCLWCFAWHGFCHKNSSCKIFHSPWQFLMDRFCVPSFWLGAVKGGSKVGSRGFGRRESIFQRNGTFGLWVKNKTPKATLLVVSFIPTRIFFVNFVDPEPRRTILVVGSKLYTPNKPQRTNAGFFLMLKWHLCPSPAAWER